MITAIFNPCGYKSRYDLFKDFAARMKENGVKLFVIECAFGEQPFSVTTDKNPLHIQVRSSSIMWIKENLINVCISKLPPHWRYVAWLDADIEFVNQDWVSDCISILKKYKVVQLFDECILLNKDKTTMAKKEGFIYKYFKGTFMSPTSKSSKGNAYFSPMDKKKGKEDDHGHPGFAWAMTRDAYEQLGGLIDFAVTGAADTFMAYSFIGELNKTTIPIKNETYLAALKSWEKKSLQAVRKNVTYLSGAIKHYWHGEFKDRQYYEREKILYETNFDPKADIKKDMQGLYQFVSPTSKLSQRLYQYFVMRNEDK